MRDAFAEAEGEGQPELVAQLVSFVEALLVKGTEADSAGSARRDTI